MIDSIGVDDFRVLELPSPTADPEIDVIDTSFYEEPRY